RDREAEGDDTERGQEEPYDHVPLETRRHRTSFGFPRPRFFAQRLAQLSHGSAKRFDAQPQQQPHDYDDDYHARDRGVDSHGMLCYPLPKKFLIHGVTGTASLLPGEDPQRLLVEQRHILADTHEENAP